MVTLAKTGKCDSSEATLMLSGTSDFPSECLLFICMLKIYIKYLLEAWEEGSAIS